MEGKKKDSSFTVLTILSRTCFLTICQTFLNLFFFFSQLQNLYTMIKSPPKINLQRLKAKEMYSC